jgi:hypothetical protein
MGGVAQARQKDMDDMPFISNIHQWLRGRRAKNPELRDSAEKALHMKAHGRQDKTTPPHQESSARTGSGHELSNQDAVLQRQPMGTANLKRSHTARSGDA